MRQWLQSAAQKVLVRGLEEANEGVLEVRTPQRTYRFGRPGSEIHARIDVHNSRFWQRILMGGDIAFGEAYMDGDWSSPDLTAVVRFAVRNLHALDASNSWISTLSRRVDDLRHRMRRNTVQGSQQNIRAHYDLSNDFFRLFLDERMMYSCAWYESEHDSLEKAQVQRLDRICRKLDLSPRDHVLEIGTGWGGFAVHAAQNYGCRVTTTTISREQHDYARAWIDREGLGGRVELLLEDYRNLRGSYHKIVSIEMFEAVGFDYYDTYFQGCDRLLDRDGSMLLQTITINDQSFERYRRRSDWIQKYIFPGGELASLRGIFDSLARATQMSVFHSEDMGAHYARTVAEWRRRFLSRLPEVRNVGFDERFIRMWELYLTYSEGAFLERHISDVQLLLTKTRTRKRLFTEPWIGLEESCLDAANVAV